MTETKETTPTDKPEAHKPDTVKVLLPRTLGERFRNAVDALSGPPHRFNLSSAGVAAFEDWVTARELEHGGPFPQRPKAAG